MGKMTIVDDEGKPLEYARFVAVGIDEEGVISNFVEDEGLGQAARVGMVVSGLSALADLSAVLVAQGEGVENAATEPPEGGDNA